MNNRSVVSNGGQSELTTSGQSELLEVYNEEMYVDYLGGFLSISIVKKYSHEIDFGETNRRDMRPYFFFQGVFSPATKTCMLSHKQMPRKPLES